MATRIQVLIPITIAALIIGVAGILSIPSDSKLEAVEFPRGTIKIDDQVLEVQIADTSPRRTRGLMFQEQMPYDQGMLFVFSEPGWYSMWMLNMQVPLDIIWFDGNGTVVHIAENIPPCMTAVEIASCPRVTSNGKEASYVLEVANGFVEQFGIDKESILKIISI